jgi:hypothetical protein
VAIWSVSILLGPRMILHLLSATTVNVLPTHSSPFTRIYGCMPMAPSIPTCSWYRSWLRLHFPADIAGQSMHCGGATALAQSEVPLDQIQAIGRWVLPFAYTSDNTPSFSLHSLPLATTHDCIFSLSPCPNSTFFLSSLFFLLSPFYFLLSPSLPPFFFSLAL